MVFGLILRHLDILELPEQLGQPRTPSKVVLRGHLKGHVSPWGGMLGSKKVGGQRENRSPALGADSR